tara:strand:+ start:2484 stop:3248 length:765 start_codon:yes stop_codon:yes gene_type:complete
MDSSDNRITPELINSITEIFVSLYKNGDYDPIDGTKTPDQRKTLKHSFKKQFKYDSAKFSQYYTCIFEAIIESDLKKVCYQRRRIKELIKEKDKILKQVEESSDKDKDKMYNDVKEELINGYFKEEREKCERITGRLSVYNERLIQKNRIIEDLELALKESVPRKEFDKLNEDYYHLKLLKDKQASIDKKEENKELAKQQIIENKELAKQQKEEDKKAEERQKKIDAFQKKKEALAAEEAELELLLNNDDEIFE